MKRFYHETSFSWLKQACAIAVFCGILGCFIYGLEHVSTETQVQQSESLRLAISRGIANCYAREGHYPESLEYLKEHYPEVILTSTQRPEKSYSSTELREKLIELHEEGDINPYEITNLGESLV